MTADDKYAEGDFVTSVHFAPDGHQESVEILRSDRYVLVHETVLTMIRDDPGFARVWQGHPADGVPFTGEAFDGATLHFDGSNRQVSYLVGAYRPQANVYEAELTRIATSAGTVSAEPPMRGI